MLKNMTEKEKMFCQRCGTEYDPAKDHFCSQCGLEFKASDKAKKILIGDIEEIESEPNPYQALRFASAVISALGWVIIIGGWFLAFTLSAIYGENIITMGGVEGEIIQNRSGLIIGVTGILSTVAGIFMIASGQVFMALLDLRNDMHATREFIRLFGVRIFEKK